MTLNCKRETDIIFFRKNRKFQGINPKQFKSSSRLTDALLKVAKIGNQHRCPSLVEMKKKYDLYVQWSVYFQQQRRITMGFFFGSLN